MNFTPPVATPGGPSPTGCGGSSEPIYAVHSSLIPVGPRRGKVLFWDRSSAFACYSGYPVPGNANRDQRWVICDPETGTAEYFFWTIPAASSAPVIRPIPGFPTFTTGGQGLFCSGHCWLPDGRLFVAGGNDWTGQQSGTSIYSGARLVSIWDPVDPAGAPQGVWRTLTQASPGQPFLEEARWYPSVVLTVAPTTSLQPRAVKVVVLGGIEDLLDPTLQETQFEFAQTDRAYLTHEAYDLTAPGPGGGNWTIAKDLRPGGNLRTGVTPAARPGRFLGPATSTPESGFPLGRSLFYYTRAHYLSDAALNGVPASAGGVIWCGGMPTISAWIDHPTDPNIWPTPRPPITTLFEMIDEPTFAVLPASIGGGGTDRLALFGGQLGDLAGGGPLTNNVFVLDAKIASPAWSASPIPPMNFARKFANAVLLPNRTVLIVGGGSNPVPGVAGGAFTQPEMFNRSTGTWMLGPAEDSPRTYHSGAVLLPSGKVVTIGGDNRTRDMQVFVPSYITPNRPQFISSPATIQYGAQFQIDRQLASGRTLAAASLTSPGSVTHSVDPNQRIVELVIVNPGAPGPGVSTATIVAPANRTKAPYGWYMMWLEDSSGDVSPAAWVQL
ncbi:MAG: galactose oxidase-like domain-containing protein [Mycobacterium sp.]